MLEKSDFMDFDTTYVWLVPSEEAVYKFINENEGMLVEPNNSEGLFFRWRFDEDEQTLKIFIVETKEVREYTLIAMEDNNFLFKKNDANESEVVIVKESEADFLRTEIRVDEVDDLDKIIIGIGASIAFIFYLLVFNFAPIINVAAGLYSLLFSVILLGLSFKYIKNLAMIISRKHKQKLKDIFFD